jgi:hypothetical protein
MLTQSLRALRDYKANPDPLAALAHRRSRRRRKPAMLSALPSCHRRALGLADMDHLDHDAALRSYSSRRKAKFPGRTCDSADDRNGERHSCSQANRDRHRRRIISAALCFARRDPLPIYERLVMLTVTAFPFAAYLFLDGIVGAPLAEYSAGEYRSIISMHAFSVACLLVLIGFTFPSNAEGARS